VCEDGAVILYDGQPLTVVEVIQRLNDIDRLKQLENGLPGAYMVCNDHPFLSTADALASALGCPYCNLDRAEAALREVGGLRRYDAVEAFVTNAELTMDDERWIKVSELRVILVKYQLEKSDD
jgi:hypothetical protein